jgi:hypothetical protein
MPNKRNLKGEEQRIIHYVLPIVKAIAYKFAVTSGNRNTIFKIKLHVQMAKNLDCHGPKP